jgi:peptidoglycan/xylan/chitin deacetylase (PgdA/CDA1 family)
MDHPLHSPGSKTLQSLLEDRAAAGMPPLSRRGFMTLAASLGAGFATGAFGADAPADPVKTTANTGYRTPQIGTLVPRSPDVAIPMPTGINPGITFSRVAMTEQYVAMSFDDGPHPQNTPRLLDMLRERNIRATFYVIGRNVELYPSVVRRVVAEGHEIGNHTYTHRSLTTLSDALVREEINKTRDAIQHAAGVQPRTLRPPYGALRQSQRQWIHAELGLPTILWSVDPLDWKRPGPPIVAQRILAGVTPGAIVLSHDLHSQTVDAMPATLDALIQKGYKFLSVSQLIAMKPAESTQAVAAPTH